MTVWDAKHRVKLGIASLELPRILERREGASIDSNAGVFEGGGLIVVVDQGPFANRVDSHSGRPGYKEELKDVAGVTGRMIFFRNPDMNAYTVALFLPAPVLVSISIQAGDAVPERVARDIIESLQITD